MIEKDPFDLAGEDPLQRDQWGRPIILRPDLPDGPCPDVRYCKITAGHGHYTRTSTRAGRLDNGLGLANWKTRHVALAVAKASVSVQALLATCHYPTKMDPCPELDEFIERAVEQAKGRDADERLHAGDWGTVVHRFSEPFSPPAPPERFHDDVMAVRDLIQRERWEVIETELFVVNDSRRVAGTLDHLVGLPDGRVVVLDKKTGDLHPMAMAIQLVDYADGVRYDPATGTRSGLHPDLDPSVGIVVHAPRGTGRAGHVYVDLDAARGWADIARRVEEGWKEQSSLFRDSLT